jgi:protoporphyrinogen oxidase
MYVPDRKIPFYRIGVYSNLGEGQNDAGSARLYAEIGYPERAALSPAEETALKARVEDALVSLGWIDPEAVDFAVVRFIGCAYVHYGKLREAAVSHIFERLERFGVYPIGRYGRWEYCSMEDSICSALETVEKMT